MKTFFLNFRLNSIEHTCISVSVSVYHSALYVLYLKITVRKDENSYDKNFFYSLDLSRSLLLVCIANYLPPCTCTIQCNP